MLKHSMGDMLKLLGVAALYALLAQLTLAVSAANGFVCVFWPASGLALAALLMGGKRYAWGVFLGALLTYVMVGKPLGVAAAVATGNTLEALFGAWLVTRDGRFDSTLRSLRDYLRLIVLAGFFGVSISALTGTAALLVSGFITAETYSHNLLHWWMGDALGIMLVAPLILVWWRTHNDRFDAKRVLEAILVIGLTFLAGQVIFLDWFHDTVGQVARGYWMYLFVTWAAVRLGTRGVVIVLIITAVQALLGAYYGTGFFADDIAKTQLANYWFYMMILSVVGMALATHFIERKQLEQQLSRRLRHRDAMERITRISLNSASIEELLGRVLDEILAVFNADRAYFLYPCDPDAPSWSVPMERTRPEWPGAFARGMVIPMTTEAAEVFREVLASTKPLPYGHAASRCIPAAVAEQFSIRSMIQMALRPSVGSSWVIGLHHCAQARAYDEDDLLIFGDIGQRVADALNSMIMLENLRASEENLNRAQAVGQVGSWFLNIATNRLEWSAETYRMFGIPQQQAVDLDTFDAATHPDDRDFVLKAWGDAMAGAPYDIEHRIVVGGQERWVRERARIERDSEDRPLAGIGMVQDITERKQLEMMLRNRTDELVLHNLVLQQISLGAPLCEVLEELARQVEALHPGMRCSILLVDEDGKYLRHGAAPGLPDFYNQAVNGLAIGDGMGACGTAAYRGERVIVVDVQQHAYWPEPYRDLARRAEVQSCWSQPIKDSNGRVLGTFAIYHQKPARPSDTEIALIERYADLTALVIERIRIQDDLRLKDLALNAAANAVVITGKDAQIKWANRAFSKLTGYSLGEAIGRPPKELLKSGKQSRSYYEQLWQTILSGEVWHGELVNRRKDGSLYHEEMTITPVPDAQGEITHFIAVKQDITERKQNEELLRESGERFRQLAENIREAFWMTDPAKNKMLYISPAYEQIWGRTLQSLYDSPRAWLEAIHGEDRQRVLHAALAKQAVGLYDEEYRIVRPNGDVRWIHDRAFPVRDSGGAVYRIVGVAEDITERKQLEMVLRESEVNMRTILDNMQDLFYRTDQDGKVIMVSASVKAVVGYEQADVVGRQVTDLYADPDARGKFLEKLEENGGMVQGYEIVLRHKDGSLVWVSTNSHFYRDGNGNVAGVEGVGRDITGRKQAEAALHESEANMCAILDNSPYLVWLKDTEGRYIKVNKVYADYIRLKDIRQIIGKTDFDLWPKELAEKYRADDAEVMVTRQQKYIEEQSLDGDRMHWVETFKTPILDGNGNVLGTTGFARDITERKLAEETLRGSENRYRSLVENSPMCIHEIGMDGRITSMNRAGVLMMEAQDESAVRGFLYLDAVSAADRERIGDLLAKAYTGETSHFEFKSSGLHEQIFKSCFVPVMNNEGSVIKLMGITEDITERKKNEELIRNLAFYDALTQLPNRRLLNDRLGQTLAASKRSGRYGALMFMDLDNFKPLNDTHGHGVGDLLLMEVARRITSCVREVDTVARFGGDEFVVILSELDADKTDSLAQASLVAEKIRTILAEPYMLTIPQEGKAEAITVEHHCTSSIGVVLFIGYESRAEDILKWADMAMYQAKECGRDLIRFFDA